MKIAVFDVVKNEKDFLEDNLKDHEILFFDKSIHDITIDEFRDCESLVIFISSKITEDIINNMPNLKIICTKSTGYDHIDMQACTSKNITVCNVPFYGENTVAEHTFALILSLSRNIHKTYVRTTTNNFSTEGIQGFDLKGKTIGIIGTGQIGLHVIKIAKGFGMEVIAYDIRENKFIKEILGFKYVSLEELLSKSDVISLHAPYTKSTHHLINLDNINLIKKGAVLVNTSRGGLIDNDALIKALDENILSGVGLDVFEGEEYLMEEGYMCNDEQCFEAVKLIKQNYNLLHRENVVITPHNAFNSVEAVNRILETTIENINAFTNGNPINLVKI